VGVTLLGGRLGDRTESDSDMAVHRLSGIDTAFLYGETPSWHMHVSAVSIIDPGASGTFSFERLREQILERLPEVPQFRMKLHEVPLGLHRPLLVDDPDFDIDFHLRHIGAPAPGGREQLGNLIGELVSWKIDRSRPLWEMWLIDGLEDGRKALLAKIHHAIIDGVSGSELATVLLDIEPDPPPRPVPEVTDDEPEQVPNDFELVVGGLLHSVSTPYRMARFARQSLRQAGKFLPFAQNEARTPPVPFQAPRTPFNTVISPHRRFAFSSVSLSDAKAVKDAFGVKLNDVVLAVCAGTLRRYLQHQSCLPDTPLIAQVPVSTRADDHKRDIGTQVSAMFASLATDVEDPAERLLAIHESTQGAKEMQKAMSAEKIMGLGETATPGLIALAARTYTAAGLDRATPPVMNLIISNVPGPPFDLYSAGARVEALYPMGPLLFGTGVNITVFSYGDAIDFGFMVCRDVIEDPWPLADEVVTSMGELVKAAEARD
jgi:diacylglycerol O-acyltransferase / wax synthase